LWHRRQTPLHLIEQLPPQIARFQQMTEAAHCRLVGHWLAAEIDPPQIRASPVNR
jgi:hypothetical protein